jgi:hypothetical protein
LADISITAPVASARLPWTRPVRGILPLQDGPHQETEAAQADKHAKRRAVGRRGKCRKDKQREFFIRRYLVTLRGQDEQRQHRKAGKDVGQQHAGKPRQSRGEHQQQADGHQSKRLAHAEHA